jgi:hypothetical protein
VRENAHTLSDFRVPTLSIECELCGRRGAIQCRQADGEIRRHEIAGASARAGQLPKGEVVQHP